MTDPTSTDELLSRVLDDEATPDERAQVAADGSLQARLALLRRTRAQLGEAPAPLDPTTVDQLVARAMAALPEQTAEAPAHAPPLAPVPTPQGTVTPIRQGLRNRPVLLGALSVAAAILLVAIAVPVLSRLGGGGSDDLATSADSQDSAESALAEVPDLGDADDLAVVAARMAAAPSSDDDGSEAAGGGDGTSDAPTAAPTEEGEQGDAAVPTSTTAPAAGETDEPSAADGEAAAVVRPVPDGADPVDWCLEQLVVTGVIAEGAEVTPATLRWEGEDAVAYLVPRAGRDQVVVVSAATCETLAGPEPADS